MLHRMKMGLGIAALGITMAVVPALTASATVNGVRSERPLQLSSFCNAYKADNKAAAASQGPAFTKAVESGKWPRIQKALLSSFNTQGGLVKQMVAYLSGAPGNVKAAGSTLLKFDATLKGIIQKSTSMKQFQSSITSAENSPKIMAAIKVLDSYTAKQCPGLITTTT